MKLIFCVTFISILCSLNIGSSAVAKEFKKFKDGETKFSDLDPDSLFLILKRLGFDELLCMAQTNDAFSRAAADVYRRKYSHLQIEIQNNFIYPKKGFWHLMERVLGNRNPHVTITYGQITIDEDGDQPIETIKHFGKFIKKLKCLTEKHNHFLEESAIGILISEYDLSSLVEIEFEQSTGALLKHMTKPLTTVETVKFDRISLVKLDRSHTLPLNELFPSMRRLELSRAEYDFFYFECHMPNLQEVYMHDFPVINHFNRFIDHNPQIRSLELYENCQHCIRKVSVSLPELESLSLSYIEMPDENIRFENVTTLTVDRGSPVNLQFPRLQSFIIDCHKDHVSQNIDFLNAHSHLTRLHLKQFSLTDVQLQQLTANLTNLVEFTLVSNNFQYNKLSSDAIVAFLRNHDQVSRLNVINFKEFGAELKDKLIDEWDTKTNGGLSFERKINYRV